MATHTLRNAQYLATEFLVDWETWEFDHEMAMVCRDIEDDLAVLIAALKAVAKNSSELASIPISHLSAGTDVAAKRTLESLETLLTKTGKVRESIARVERERANYQIANIREYETLCNAIKLSAERICWRSEKGLFRVSPRPVLVSEDGQLSEVDGTSINMEALGLDKEAIRRDLADPGSIQYRSLREVIADGEQ